MKKLMRISSALLVIATLCSLLAFSVGAASLSACDCLTDTNYAKTYALAASGRITVCKDTKVETPANPNTDMIDVTAYFAVKTITVQSVENSKHLHPDPIAATIPPSAP